MTYTNINKSILENLDQVLQSSLISNNPDPDNNVGVGLLVIHKGEEVYRNQFGYADKEKNLPIKSDSIFRCYSMTKPVTAVAVLSLVEKAVISLSDPVSKYIPSFKNQTVLTEKGSEPANREVRIQDLMDMTAGVCYPDTSFPAGAKMEDLQTKFYSDLENGITHSTVELANMIGEIPLAFQPGSKWLYGFCADVLGAIVEIASKMPYSDYLKKTIFEPLDMKDTDFYVPEEKQDRLMINYQYMPESQTLEPCTWQHLCLSHFHKKKPEFESGGAGLVSTMDDYSHFVKMLLNNGIYNGKRILSPKTMELLGKNHLTAAQLESLNWEQLRGYGYGNLCRTMIDVNASEMLGSEGEFGWDGWLGCYMFVDPKQDLGIVYVIQKCGGNGFRDIQDVRNIIYSALE